MENTSEKLAAVASPDAGACLAPLQVLEEFCDAVEAAGETAVAHEWPELHRAYTRAALALVAAGWRGA